MEVPIVRTPVDHSRDQMNKPIFIVGSPRSGTSILSWCLGQHSNVFVQEESNWLGQLAIQIDIAYTTGTARGPRSQLSALDIQREEFFASFGQSINDLILRHRERLEANIKRRRASMPAGTVPPTALPEFKISRAQSDRKQRWVDGTPEYSFYTCPLLKLFPEARFIHVLREVSSVVRSILNFERTGGPALVPNEQAAYEYWLRTVRACRQAERAYGSEVMCRVRFSDLIEQPEATLSSLLEFLGEPFESNCLEPLRKRINSSQVSGNFDSADGKTDPAIIAEAHRLDSELANETPAIEADSAVRAEIEATFNARVSHVADLAAKYQRCCQRAAELETELQGLQPGKQLSGFVKIASLLGLR